MKVMVIDDSGVMRRIHINVLKDRQIEAEILEAEDGQKALELAQVNHVDLFLVDWNMPKLDGLELVKTLRLIDEYAETPIIMITSEAARYNVVEAIQAGVTNYIGIVSEICGQIWARGACQVHDTRQFAWPQGF